MRDIVTGTTSTITAPAIMWSLFEKAYPDKHNVSTVLINFTTKKEHCTYFPSNERNDISLLNVRVFLDASAKIVTMWRSSMLPLSFVCA